MSQRSEPKKKSNTPLIVGIVIGVVVLIVIIVVIIILLLRRRSSSNQTASTCATDADCLLGFKCNTATKTCSQCLTDADCTGGKKCTGPVCVCPGPLITNATATVVQAWPPKIEVFVDSSGGDYETMKYKIFFTNSTGTYTSPSEFVVNPGTTAPTFTLELSPVCGGLYSNYGCEVECPGGSSVSGKISIQIENECGNISPTTVVPLSGNCDFCSLGVCE